HCRLVLTPGEVAALSNGYFRYSVTIQRPDATQVLVYTNQSRSLNGFLEVFDGPLPNPHFAVEIEPSVFQTSSWGNPLLNYQVSSSFVGAAQRDNKSGLHTLAFYL